MNKLYNFVFLLIAAITNFYAPIVHGKQQEKNDRQIIVHNEPKNDSALTMVDKIEVIIFGEEPYVITYSDKKKRSLEGAERSLDDIILERLIVLDGKKFKITPDEEAIDRYLAMIQRENNLSLNDIEEMFRSAGYTFEEGRAQLGIMFVVNSVIDFRIKSRLIVPEKDIVAYYNANPEIEPASIQIERIVIPITAGETKAMQRKKIERVLNGHELADAQWSSPFWVNIQDLAPEKQFIGQLKINEISMPVYLEDGIELFRLRAKKEECLVPLEKRYHEISGILRRPLFEKLFNEYKKKLFEEAAIVYF